MFSKISLMAVGILILGGALSAYNAQDKGASSSQEGPLSTDPGNVRIDLALITDRSKDTESASSLLQQVVKPFTVGQKIRVQVVMTNNSSEAARALVLDTFYQNRPRLLRNGEELPYRKDVQKVLPRKDADPEFLRTDNILLVPYQETKVEIINLNDWYEPLEPGSYELANRHRFSEGGKWFESSAVTFEVQPKP